MRHDFGVPKSHSPTCSLSFSHASHQDLGPLFLFCKFCFLIKKNLSTLYSELSWYYLSSIPPIWCLRHHLVPYLETSTLLPGTSQFVSLCTFFFHLLTAHLPLQRNLMFPACCYASWQSRWLFFRWHYMHNLRLTTDRMLWTYFLFWPSSLGTTLIVFNNCF